ncbi:MAG TPA: DMT family transporter [Xanthobacteraceae bacterium]|nr:DMT family transporter [Xanthobacteraceae bacterium]
MLGGFFALMAAATFAWTNAAVRRGVRSGTVAQATTLSIPVGVPIFLAALLLSGRPDMLLQLPATSLVVFAAVGVSHFCIGRYCNYRAINAIGNNLAGPIMQFNLVVSLSLAIVFLGETLTALRMLGIVMIVAGPAIVSRSHAREREQKVSAELLFSPRFAEGYFFAFLAAICYGASPALVRFASNGQGLSAGLAGGVVAAFAATMFMGLLLLVPGRWRELRATPPDAARWFLSSGMMVYVSQIFAYMAVSIAPVTITAPIIGLANVFRLHFARWLNPKHEVFGPEVVVATAISFLGVVAISLSLDVLPVPEAWRPLLDWRWP